MEIKICNPEKNQYGNSKDNIFLAFDITETFLGSAYAYSAINYYQTSETPYTIFIDIDVVENEDKVLEAEVRQKLFNKVFFRAKELRIERPKMKCRVYSGFEFNKDKMNFFIKNGFEEDYSIIMGADIPENFAYQLPKDVIVTDCKINTDEDIIKYKTIYDELFVTPFDINVLKEQEKQNYFKNLSFLDGDKVIGGCTIFEKDGFGYIETIYVLPDSQGKGLSKIIVNYIFDYFLSKGLNKTKLEVWQLNKRAVNLYKSLGYKEVEKNLMFPGITL